MTRHPDFERIKNEFETYYCKGSHPCPRGTQEYNIWLAALRLDETVPYGSPRESFTWARDMIKFLREDKDNKYYQILVGFPVRSMNGNVYKERDFIAAALSLVGAHPSLNHKDEFWFSPENPKNRWGILTVIGAKYEDGAVETILQVPKSAICPICNGSKMTELIDTKQIVNVSLEGDCKGGFCQTTGVCDGFVFLKKGFSLLTTDVLPGMPMARIFPIEAYLPFSQARHPKRVQIVGIENMSKKPKEGEISGGPNPDEQPEQVAPDAKGQCPEGYQFSAKVNACVKLPAAPTTQTHTPEGTTVTSGTPAANDTSHKPIQPAEAIIMLAREILKEGSFEDCVAAVMAKGKDEESARAICAAQCNQSLESTAELKVQKIKAEQRAQALDVQNAELTLKLEQAYKHQQNLDGQILQLRRQLDESVDKLEKQVRTLNEEKVTDTAAIKSLGRRLEDMTTSRDDYKKNAEDSQAALEATTGKYKATLTQNLALTKKVTDQNEEWLKINKDREQLEEKLKATKRMAKRIVTKF